MCIRDRPRGAGLQRAQGVGSLRDRLARFVVDDRLGRCRRAVYRDDQPVSAAHGLGDTMILRPTRSLAARNASSAFSSGKVWVTMEATSTSPSSTSRIVRGYICLLYTSDAADDLTRVDLGGRRIIK